MKTNSIIQFSENLAVPTAQICYLRKSESEKYNYDTMKNEKWYSVQIATASQTLQEVLYPTQKLRDDNYEAALDIIGKYYERKN